MTAITALIPLLSLVPLASVSTILSNASWELLPKKPLLPHQEDYLRLLSFLLLIITAAQLANQDALTVLAELIIKTVLSLLDATILLSHTSAQAEDALPLLLHAQMTSPKPVPMELNAAKMASAELHASPLMVAQ